MPGDPALQNIRLVLDADVASAFAQATDGLRAGRPTSDLWLAGAGEESGVDLVGWACHIRGMFTGAFLILESALAPDDSSLGPGDIGVPNRSTATAA